MSIDGRVETIPGIAPPEKPHIQSPEIGRRRFLTALGLTIATIVGGQEGLSRVQQQEGWATRIIKAGAAWWEGRLQQNAADAKGETFNPNAQSGEISAKNSETIPLQDALKLISTTDKNEGYIILPNFGDNVLKYVNKRAQYGETTEIKGLPSDITFVSPYDGYLSWTRYELSDSIGVELRKAQFGIGQPEDLKFRIVYGTKNQNLELLFPEDVFTVRELGQKGMRTFYTSQIPIKAGQPIFTLKGKENIDMGIGGAKILSDNQKAVVISPTS